MAKRQLYYRVDIRNVERLLGELRARGAMEQYGLICKTLEWLGVTPDADKILAYAEESCLPAWVTIDTAFAAADLLGNLKREEL